jgi:hypothetical protein
MSYVEFRGVMLYCTELVDGARRLSQVLLPDAEGTSPPFDPEIDGRISHLDGSLAVPHYAGILVVPKTGSSSIIPISGARVQFKTDDAGTPDVTAVIEQFACLGRASGPGDPLVVKPFNVSADGPSQILVDAGSALSTMIPLGLAGYTSEFLGKSDPALSLALTITSPLSLVITRPDGTTTTPIADDTRLYVFNYDQPFPDVEALHRVTPPSGGQLVDDDFKWIYALVKPKTGDLKKWSKGTLPAPTLRKIGSPVSARFITVATCWPGWI